MEETAMNQSLRFTKGRLIAFLCCSLLPLAGIGLWEEESDWPYIIVGYQSG